MIGDHKYEVVIDTQAVLDFQWLLERGYEVEIGITYDGAWADIGYEGDAVYHVSKSNLRSVGQVLNDAVVELQERDQHGQ